MRLTIYDVIAIVLVIIGAINWGLMGIFNFDLVAVIFKLKFLCRIIYLLIGAAGVWTGYLVFKNFR